MATIKSFTDIEQSKKLAEILSLESADGFYEAQQNPTTGEWEDLLFVGNEWASEEVVIPAWSLSALLGVIPKYIEGSNRLRIDLDNVDFSIWYDDLNGYGVNDKLPDITLKEPVDACVEMLFKLHEQKLL